MPHYIQVRSRNRIIKYSEQLYDSILKRDFVSAFQHNKNILMCYADILNPYLSPKYRKKMARLCNAEMTKFGKESLQ